MFREMLLRYVLSDKRFELIDELGTTDNVRPRISCVIPVFNQSKIIYSHLWNIINHARGDIELIIIDDASKDSTRKEILKFISDVTLPHKNLLNVKLYKTKISVYESRAEDFGFRVSQGEYILGIQADMKILQSGFDDQLVSALTSQSDLSLLSCRGTHSIRQLDHGLTHRGRELSDTLDFKIIFRPIIKLKQKCAIIYGNLIRQGVKNENLERKGKQSHQLELNWADIFPNMDSKSAGWLGENIDFLPYEYDSEFAEKMHDFSKGIWIGETVMRGPLFMRRQDYLDLGGYNTRAFFQGLDDHDLSLRFNQTSKRVGFYPIYFSSPSSLRVSGKTGKRTFVQRLSSQIHASLRRKHFRRSELMKFLNFGRIK